MGLRVHLVHGIHSVGPDTSVERLRPFLEAEGLECLYPDYGYELGIGTALINPMIRGTLIPYIQPGDLYIGHSNGCAIGYDLMLMGAPIAGAVFINAALEQDIRRLPVCKFIDVYFNEGDQTTVLAKVAAALHLVDPVYGEMGHAGYVGGDGAIQNIDCGRTQGMPAVSGHSEFFNSTNLPTWGPFLAKRLASKAESVGKV